MGGQAAEAELIDQATRANNAYVVTFTSLKARPAAALRKLNELEEGVTGPIERLQKFQAAEVAENRRSASGASARPRRGPLARRRRRLSASRLRSSRW